MAALLFPGKPHDYRKPHFQQRAACRRGGRGEDHVRRTGVDRAGQRAVSRDTLLQEVWGPRYEQETNYLRVYMATLRRKLEEDPSRPRHLLTEPGMGYRFVA